MKCFMKTDTDMVHMKIRRFKEKLIFAVGAIPTIPNFERKTWTFLKDHRHVFFISKSMCKNY